MNSSRIRKPIESACLAQVCFNFNFVFRQLERERREKENSFSFHFPVSTLLGFGINPNMKRNLNVQTDLLLECADPTKEVQFYHHYFVRYPGLASPSDDPKTLAALVSCHYLSKVFLALFFEVFSFYTLLLFVFEIFSSFI